MTASSLSAAGQWRMRTTFLLALSASAVGFGNLWRFSYLTGEYGGAPFVLTYLLCLFLFAVPVMVAEVVLGRHGRGAPPQAIQRACDRSLLHRGWVGVGWLACIAALLVLAFYVVTAGWAMAYARYLYIGVFSAAPALEVAHQFERFVTDPLPQLYWQSLFLLVTAGVVLLGVRRGLGLLVWVAVPALAVLLGYLIRFGLANGDIAATRDFLFSARLVDFTPRAALAALGHAFYTLGVGVGTGICYGAYAHASTPVGRSVMAVAVFDTAVALCAGLAIFPVVFANHLEPTMGPGLLFVSVPYAFGNLVQGEVFGTGFFLLVVLAALGSAVAIMEPVVAALMQRFRIERLTAVAVTVFAVWWLAVAVVTSFRTGAGAWYGNRNLFGLLDVVAAAVLLPLVSLFTAILVGWRMRPEILRTALHRESRLFFAQWRFLLRYVVPPAIGVLMLASFTGGTT